VAIQNCPISATFGFVRGLAQGP